MHLDILCNNPWLNPRRRSIVRLALAMALLATALLWPRPGPFPASGVAGSVFASASGHTCVLTATSGGECRRGDGASSGLLGAPPDGSAAVLIQFRAEPTLGMSTEGREQVEQRMREMDADRVRLAGDLSSMRARSQPFEHDYRRLWNGIATTLPLTEVAVARSLPYVKAVFKDEPVQAVLNDSVPLIGADQVWSKVGATGAGVRIAVIDTGVNYSHPDLGACFGAGCKVVGGYDFYNGDSDPDDDNGHGTHVAAIAAANGVVKGVAPDAQILAYKVLGAGGSGSSSDIIAALEAAADPDGNPATDDGAHVVNLSLGALGNPDDPLSQAVDNASSAGIVVAAAAGNSGPGVRSIGSPGTAREAITVGATDKFDVMADFSSRGPVVWEDGAIIKPDIVAPGVSICASRWESAWAGQECIDEQHIAISGTSMATPHVAGAAALLLELYPSWTPAEVKLALRNEALDLGYGVNSQGYGRLQVLPAAQLPHAPPIASITTSGLIVSTTDIYGSATSDYFQGYALSMGEGMDPGSWTLLKESTTAVSDNVLYAGFDPSGLPDGFRTLRLDVTDSAGLVSQDRVLVKIDNITIATPLNNDILRKGDAIEIRGSILGGAEFQNYIIEYGLGDEPTTWLTSGITLASGGTVPVANGLLATWDTSVVGSGDYFTVRLTVNNDWGQSSESVRDLYLDPTLRPGWPQRIPWDFEPDPFKRGVETTWESFSYVQRSSEADSIVPAGALVTGRSGEPGFSTLESGIYYWGGFLEPVVSDLDNDGDEEIVVYTGGTPPEIRVYRDDGSLYWSAPIGTTAIAGGNMHIPLVVDINKDGFKEIIAYEPISDPSKVYAFSHDGSLLPGWPVSVPQEFRPTLLAADLNQDGNKEIVIKSNNAFLAMTVIVDSSGEIVSQWSIPGSSWGASIVPSPAVGNFDADPELEIVIAGPSEFAGYDGETGEWNNTGVIHVYNTDGSELPGWPVYTDGVIFSSPAVGDINEDGQDEIVVGLMYESGVFPDCRYGGVYAFDRSGNVLPGWPFEKCYNFWSSPSLGDLDGDGDLEIATSRLGSETYVVHHDGSLAAGWPQATGWSDYYSTILADVDGDGAPDVVTTAGSASLGGGVYAWRYDGSSISGFPKLTEVDAQGPATIADIDQDGQIELLASSNWDTDLETGLPKYRGSLYVWDISEPYEALSMEWPHFHRDGQHTGMYRSPAEQPPPKATPAPTPTPTSVASATPAPTPTPTSGPGIDSDGDGCADALELGPNETLGGRRDPNDFWDFMDVWTGSPATKNRAVSIGDIGAIVARFGSFQEPPPTEQEALAEALNPPPAAPAYHAAFDRGGPMAGQELWNLRPPDGNIDIGDIGAVVAQFGHRCV